MSESARRHTTLKMCEDALWEAFGNISAAAELLKINRVSLWRRINRHERLQIAKNEGEERAKDFAEIQLLKGVRAGSLRAIEFFLECKAKDRGWVRRQEITGSDGGPMNVSSVSHLSDAELRDIAGVNETASST